MEMVIQIMTDFEALLLFLALLLFVSSLVFMFRWMAGSTNDFIGLFSVGGIAVSIAVPYIVVPDALDDAVKALLSPFTKVGKDFTDDFLSEAERSLGRVVQDADRTTRAAVQDVRQSSWLTRMFLGGKRRAKKRA
jgi:hypothetical protein